MRKLLALCIPALAALLAVTSWQPAPAASDFATFATPSHGIGCVYSDGFLRCDVNGGVVPLPPRPKSCELDWGQGYWLKSHGRAGVVCAGDTALGATTIVPYGTTWRRGSIACASSTDGLRCTNADHHGFFISRGQAHSF
jgi:hypothetical protein